MAGPSACHFGTLPPWATVWPRDAAGCKAGTRGHGQRRRALGPTSRRVVGANGEQSFTEIDPATPLTRTRALARVGA